MTKLFEKIGYVSGIMLAFISIPVIVPAIAVSTSLGFLKAFYQEGYRRGSEMIARW